jgi:hypothetical protein
MTFRRTAVDELRRELRAARGDRALLSKLHTVVTNKINHVDSYGEEKIHLVRFREEIRELLKCRVPGD